MLRVDYVLIHQTLHYDAQQSNHRNDLFFANGVGKPYFELLQ